MRPAVRAWTIIGLMLSGTGSANAGPISTYYITNGDLKSLQIIQGNKIIGGWTLKDNTYPIAVMSTVKAYSTFFNNVGAEYTLAGVYTGTNYSFQGDAGESLDGATDAAAHNYLLSHITSKIYQFDLDWKNPVLLFTLPTRPTGITFDQNTGTLWISRDGGFLEEYTTGGTLLHSFSYGTGRLGALAWEPATDTLWGVVNHTSEIRQFSPTTGKLLQNNFISNLSPTVNVWGGEFVQSPPAPAASTPEPAGIVVFLMLLIGAAIFARRRRRLQAA